MPGIIVLFPKLEDADTIKNRINRCGFEVSAVCTTGFQAAGLANDLGQGLVVCGYRFSDMFYQELKEYLPEDFRMLLLASAVHLSDCMDKDITSLVLPVKNQDFIDAMQQIMNSFAVRERRKNFPALRSAKEKEIVAEAKELLMQNKNMTEEEAHRYIQKASMDSGVNLIEMAEMILTVKKYS